MPFGVSKFTDWGVDRKTMTVCDSGEALKPPRVTLNAIERTNATLGNSEIIIED